MEEKKRNTIMSHGLGKYSNQKVITRREPEIGTRPVISLTCSTTGRFPKVAVVPIGLGQREHFRRVAFIYPH